MNVLFEALGVAGGIAVMVAGTLAWLAFSEAILKPHAIALAHGLTPRLLAEGLVAMDRLLPELLEEGISVADVEHVMRQRLSLATGVEWSADQMMAARRVFDPVRFVQHQTTRSSS